MNISLGDFVGFSGGLGLGLLLPLFWLAVLYEIWRSRGFRPRLALQQLILGGDPNIVYIRGRRSGLIAYLLARVHIDDKSTLRVTPSDITLDRASAFGFATDFLPMRDVSSIVSGYYRAFSFLILSLLAIGWSLLSCLLFFYATNHADYVRMNGAKGQIASMVALLIYAGLLFLLYQLSKSFYVRIESQGGNHLGISFKRSLIEGQVVGLEQAMQIAEIMNNQQLRMTR